MKAGTFESEFQKSDFVGDDILMIQAGGELCLLLGRQEGGE